MLPRAVALCSILSPIASAPIGYSLPRQAPAEIHLTVATLHAAALTAPRGASDAEDGPFLLVSILGPGASTATVHLPATGHLTIHQDEALGTRPLVDLTLQPGDSVRLLVSVLEGPGEHQSDEAQAAASSAKALAQSAQSRTSVLSSALASLTGQGAHWLGSVVLLLTNENGAAYWRTLECVATCKVLKAPAGAALVAEAAAPNAGVVELSGNGGTYHLQLQGQRKS